MLVLQRKDLPDRIVPLSNRVIRSCIFTLQEQQAHPKQPSSPIAVGLVVV
jgi:hypothetical protein